MEFFVKNIAYLRGQLFLGSGRVEHDETRRFIGRSAQIALAHGLVKGKGLAFHAVGGLVTLGDAAVGFRSVHIEEERDVG
jgi:hypothetical protein